jgi:hypothetical protein
VGDSVVLLVGDGEGVVLILVVVATAGTDVVDDSLLLLFCSCDDDDMLFVLFCFVLFLIDEIKQGWFQKKIKREDSQRK